jgi:hypothetical protein
LEPDQNNKVTSVALPLVLSLTTRLKDETYMDKTIITGIAAALALVVMSYLMFQSFGPPATLKRVMLIYTTLDSNGDGTLDSTEIESASQRLLQLDDNGDGTLSGAEIYSHIDD